MAFGTTLEQLREMVRDECGISSNTSRGSDNAAYLNRLIYRYNETLAEDYDWPTLRVENSDATKLLQAGQRYYDFPAVMDISNTIECWLFWGNVWLKLDYGIGPIEYSAYNSDNNAVRADPALKWRIKDERQFEVWPIPASNGIAETPSTPAVGPMVRFTGRRKFTALNSDSARCDVDDQTLVLFVSAEVLAKMKQADAPLKLVMAKDRLLRVKSRVADRRQVRIGMGDDSMENNTNTGWPRIRVYPASN